MAERDPDSILFEEKKPPTRRKANLFKAHVARVFSGNLLGIVGNLFLGQDRVPAPVETPEPPPPEPKSVTIARQWPLVAAHVHADPPRAESSPDHIATVFDNSFNLVTTFCDNLLVIQQRLSAKKSSIQSKVEEVKGNTSGSLCRRSHRLVLLDLKDELRVQHEIFLTELQDVLMHIMNYARALHEEQPHDEITIDTSDYLTQMETFPDSFPPAKAIREKINRFKQFRIEEPRPLRRRLTIVVDECASEFDTALCYFPDHGTTERTFVDVFNELSSDFHRRMQHRISRCVNEPHRAGLIILDQCSDFIKTKKKQDKNANMKYFFILFSRFYFADIYVRAFAVHTVRFVAETQDFHTRVFRLRRVSPIGFGFGTRYIPEMYGTFNLADFPRNNMYTPAISKFQEMNFLLCPIDFCVAAKEALEITQQIARDLAFKVHMDETKQVLAKSDHSLSYDELFDIGLIVFLLSDPVDTVGLIRAFEPFISGLQLPSELNWAFTNIKGMCEHILKLNIAEIIALAKQRLQKEQEMDPLNILRP
jgi:hypothetical protein